MGSSLCLSCGARYEVDTKQLCYSININISHSVFVKCRRVLGLHLSLGTNPLVILLNVALHVSINTILLHLNDLPNMGRSVNFHITLVPQLIIATYKHNTVF